MPDEQRNKRAARTLYEEALGQGHLDIIDDVIASDFVNHTDPDGPTGPRGVRATFRANREVAPEYRFVVEHVIAEDDLVVVHGMGRTGVMRGEYRGVDVTGRSDDAAHAHILRFRDGYAIEHWGVRQGGGSDDATSCLQPPGTGWRLDPIDHTRWLCVNTSTAARTPLRERRDMRAMLHRRGVNTEPVMGGSSEAVLRTSVPGG